MCLLFFVINDNCSKDEFRLILANNRDEFWQRPTQAAHVWPKEAASPQCIGGVDKEPGREGGTWLGVNTAGHIACLVNISSQQDPTKIGRGFLVTDFLRTTEPAEKYFENIALNRDSYNGFHLTLMELRQRTSHAFLVTNDKEADQSVVSLLSGGVHAVGNSPVKKPWCKVDDGKVRFESIVHSHRSTSSKEDLVTELFNLMADKSLHWPDQQLQKQAEDCKWTAESTRAKSAICVWDSGRKYGTRTTTLLLVNGAGNCDYIEKSLQTPVNVVSPQWSTKFYGHVQFNWTMAAFSCPSCDAHRLAQYGSTWQANVPGSNLAWAENKTDISSSIITFSLF